MFYGERRSGVAYLELMHGAVLPEGGDEIVLTDALADVRQMESRAGLENVRAVFRASLQIVGRG